MLLAKKYMLCNMAITEILHLFKNPLLRTADLEGWLTHRDLEKFESLVYLPEENRWETVEIEVAHEIGSVTFRYRPIIAAAVKPLGFVLALIIFSDATNLTANGRQTAHPFVVSFANIPEAERWKSGGTEVVALFPPLPSDMAAEEKMRVFQEALRIVFGPVIALSSPERGNIYRAVPLDIMHVVDKGFWLHSMKSLLASLTPTERAMLLGVVDAHVLAYPYQRSEWRLVKVHLLSHLSTTIRDRGMSLQYSMNQYEHSHKTTAKRPARGGN
ncbi:unnamed protein product [Closterium sp. Naga37s-1]|nr:unnamed protein product [Closterium sp. Naga37s-1]